VQYLIYDPRSRRWLTESGAWSDDLHRGRRFMEHHEAEAVWRTLPNRHALYITEAMAPDQP
jgi:hypothetical protein